MEIVPIRTRSQFISAVIVFASLATALDCLLTPGFTAGVWFGVVFLITPLIGIILGPYFGFLTAMISVLIGHAVVFRGSVYEFLFALGAPMGATVSGLMFRGEWRLVLLFYSAALAAFFLTPISWQLPLWGIWNCLTAYAAIIPAAIIIGRGAIQAHDCKRLSIVLGLCAFIGLEADVLFRIFLFIPCRTYWLFYGLAPEALRMIWVTTAPTVTPIKVFISALLTAGIGTSLARARRTL
ncbi:MAG: hypothetical protein ACE5OY_02415 [Candidatus Bathyarchaeia archaeon]